MKLYDTLEKQLKKENNFVTDNGELKKWVVINKAQNFDAGLIELLQYHSNPDLDELDKVDSCCIESIRMFSCGSGASGSFRTVSTSCIQWASLYI